MITINLFDYRQELRKIAIQKQVMAAAFVVIAAFALSGVSWFVEQTKLDGLRTEIAEVEEKVNALDGKVKAIQKMQSQQTRLTQIITGILTLRTDHIPPTQLLFDINQAVPDALWLETVQEVALGDLQRQKAPLIFVKDPEPEKKKDEKKDKKPEREAVFIEIKGKFYSENSVAQFMQNLEKTPYFKKVFLFKTEKPEKEKTPERAFTIYCYMGDIKETA